VQNLEVLQVPSPLELARPTLIRYDIYGHIVYLDREVAYISCNSAILSEVTADTVSRKGQVPGGIRSQPLWHSNLNSNLKFKFKFKSKLLVI
jgi:hypothetical protein